MNYIRPQTPSWLGHINRVTSERTIKMVWYQNVRWEDDTVNDLKVTDSDW